MGSFVSSKKDEDLIGMNEVFERNDNMQRLFFDACQIFFLDDEKEYKTRVYMCLFIYTKAYDYEESWVKDKEIITLVKNCIDKIEFKDLMIEKMIEKVKKIISNKRLNESF